MLLSQRAHRRDRTQHWRQAAEDCGLSQPTETRLSVLEAELTATWKGHPFHFSGRHDTHIVVGLPVRDAEELTLRRALPGASLERGEIEIGDNPFDDAFVVHGAWHIVLARLDAEMRGWLLQLHHDGDVAVLEDRVHVEVWPRHRAGLTASLDILLKILPRLTTKIDVVESLARNALADPEPGVRTENLLALIHEHGGHPRTLDTLRAASHDPHPPMRLRAARERGTEGVGILFELAEGLTDDESSAGAVAALAQQLTPERTRALLARALQRRSYATAEACVELLGRVGDATAEPELVRLLTHEHAPLRLAACAALGTAGSVNAVLPLKERADRKDADKKLRRAAREAVAHIQSRQPGATPGQLSMSPSAAEVGTLSLAAKEAGGVSLADDADGRLSRSDPED